MNKIYKNVKGFSVVELALVIVVVVAIGLAGWLVYKDHHKTGLTKITNSQNSNFVNVIQNDNSVIQESPNKIAKTTDQVRILTALHNTCDKPSASNVNVNIAVFDAVTNGNYNFKQDGNYAFINAGICAPVGNTIDAIFVGGGDAFLHKNSLGNWVYDTTDAGLPVNCSNFDGLGYPTTIKDRCYDQFTSSIRAPR